MIEKLPEKFVNNLNDEFSRVGKRLKAIEAVVDAARKVHRKVSSMYRTQVCVKELKVCVAALEELEK